MRQAGTVTGRFAAMTLALEAFVVFFATLVASRLSELDPSLVWVAGSGLAVLCLLVAGVVRRPGGIVVGSVVQVMLLATGFWVPAMFGLGAVFVAMWVWLLVVGRRIDRDRAAWPAGPPSPEHVDG